MKLKVLLASASATLMVGCATPTVDKTSVQATAAAPTSMQVDAIRIPFDPSQPMYVVTV